MVRKRRKILKNGVNGFSVDERHHFAALAELRAAGTLHFRKKYGLQMALKCRRGDRPMSSRKSFLYSRSCNIVAELVLPDQRFQHTLRSLMVFASTFEMDYVILFDEAKTTAIAQELLLSNLVPGPSLASYMRQICITKFVLRMALLFEYPENSAAPKFAVTNLEDKRLSSCSISSTSDSVVLLNAESMYLLNPASRNGHFPCRPIYYVADKFGNALHALFNDIRAFNMNVFPEDGFKGFLVSEVTLCRTVKPAVNEIFFNDMKQFGHDSCDRQKSPEQQVLDRQRGSIHGIRNVFLKSTTAVPLQPTAIDVALDANP